MSRSLITSHLFRLAALTFMSGGHSVLANDSVVVSSSSSGQNIYEVVFESSRTTTDSQPGIYTISTKGVVTPAILGQVLGVSKGFNGVLAQSSFSQGTNDAATSVAVVNGKLVFFNRATKAKGKMKPLILGESGLQVFDPLLGQEFKLQSTISDLDDLSVLALNEIKAQADLPFGGQLFLISIKEKSAFGDGVTMGVVLEKGQSETIDRKSVV